MPIKLKSCILSHLAAYRPRPKAKSSATLITNVSNELEIITENEDQPIHSASLDFLTPGSTEPIFPRLPPPPKTASRTSSISQKKEAAQIAATRGSSPLASDEGIVPPAVVSADSGEKDSRLPILSLAHETSCKDDKHAHSELM